MAAAAGLTIVYEALEPRTLLYAPSATRAGEGAAAIPRLNDVDVVDAMIAFAVGVHLYGLATPAAYVRGEALRFDARHRAAVAFARAFIAVTRPNVDQHGRDVGRAG